MSGRSRNTTDAIFLLTIIGELCATRKYIESEDHEAVIETGCRDLLKSVFFLRGGTCCSVAQQTRGMPGPIKDGMHWWPGLDKSFPKIVTLQTKRENENAQLRSTLFSRSSKRHGWDEIDAKFESSTIYFLKFTKILFMMIWGKFRKLLENHWGFNLLRSSKNHYL